MKRYLFVTAILLATGLHATAQTPEQLWESANTAYINENYQEAVKDYESIRAQGYESDQLYLNLGNAYFKRGMTGKAIVNYNRALRLSPSDEDVLYNLGIANTYVQDKIDVVPTFFVHRWMAELRSGLTSNAWAGLSVADLPAERRRQVAQSGVLRSLGYDSTVYNDGYFCRCTTQNPDAAERCDHHEQCSPGQKFPGPIEQRYFRPA